MTKLSDIKARRAELERDCCTTWEAKETALGCPIVVDAYGQRILSDPNSTSPSEAEFIAHAPTDLTHLLGLVERQREMLGRLEWCEERRHSVLSGCPLCLGDSTHGHATTCELAALLEEVGS